jgi:MOSC domain-containing protein YiiM
MGIKEGSIPMNIHALNVGKAQVVNGFRTAFAKEPVGGALRLGALGFEGDDQANKKYHGGPEKAVCCYPLAHYDYWDRLAGRPLARPIFGENLTLTDCTEETVYIGDVYQVGGAVVQVCQPRVPCDTLVKRHQWQAILQEATRTGFTGFYLRMLTEGLVAVGDALILLERPAETLSIAEANETFYRQRDDRTLLNRLHSLPALSADWRDWAANRLHK